MNIKRNEDGVTSHCVGDETIVVARQTFDPRHDFAFICRACFGARQFHVCLPDFDSAQAREYAAALLQAADDVDRLNARQAAA